MASIQMKKVITNMTMTPTTPGSPPSPTVGTSDAAALASANDTNKKPRFSFQVGSLFIIFSALLDQQILEVLGVLLAGSRYSPTLLSALFSSKSSRTTSLSATRYRRGDVSGTSSMSSTSHKRSV